MTRLARACLFWGGVYVAAPIALAVGSDRLTTLILTHARQEA